MRVWRKTKLLAILGTGTAIFQFLHFFVLAGPVKRSSRMIREVYPEIEPEKLQGNQAEVCIVGDVVYGAEEPVPADQPCLKCKCQPPGVQCETTRCAKKPGCRAIHKPNECCPAYQCECEHEGRFYANGERLETPPGGECRVCYCRGGEVQCAEVSCYIRTDCEGRTVPGQCCPKYDHCPPREPTIDRVVPHTTQPSLITNTNSETLGYWSSSNTSVEDQVTTAVYDIQGITNEDSNKITETQTEATLLPTITENQMPSDNLDDANKIHIHEIKLIDEGTQTDPLDDESLKQTFVQFTDHDNRSTPRNVVVEVRDVPKITIQEIIPEIKEIPITGPPKREINIRTHGQTFDESVEFKTNKIGSTDDNSSVSDNDNGGDLALSDTESDSSEISEIYHHPPPVLKIGDQLLFLKKGQLVPGKDISTPLPVITIIGAEGLQRGTEDSGESHDVASQVQEPQKEIAVSEGPQYNETDNLSTAASHIISFVRSKNKIDDSTKSSVLAIEDLLLNLTKDQPTTNENFYREELDPSTTIMAENIVNRIKTLTNIESTTDVAHLVQKVFIADVNSTESLSAEENTTDVADKWYETQPVTKDSSEEENSTLIETTPLFERLDSSVIPLSTKETEREENITDSSIHRATSLRYDELGEPSRTKHDEESILIEQNPEYPPIPDIMSPQNIDELAEHLDSELAQIVSSEKPLVVQENSSFTLEIFTDTTESSSLKPEIQTEARVKESGVIFRLSDARDKSQAVFDDQNKAEIGKNHPLINEKAALPVSLLKQAVSSDQVIEEKEKDLELQLAESKIKEARVSSKELQSVNNNSSVNHIKSIKNVAVDIPVANASVEVSLDEVDRSKETLEETSTEDSGESTTPSNRHASVILSVEDASVETTNSGSREVGTTDMVEMIPGFQGSSEEIENKSENKDVSSTTVGITSSMEKDVELIDPKVFSTNLKPKENLIATNASIQNKSLDNKTNVLNSLETSDKSKENRPQWSDRESDDIFKQLNEEIQTARPNIFYKVGDEDAQAEAIFRELLEEATSSTLLPDSNTKDSGVGQTRQKESALLQKVSEAITKFQTKESRESLDTSILGILRDFFSSQYKQYDTKK